MTSVVPRTASTLRSRVRTLAVVTGEPLKGVVTEELLKGVVVGEVGFAISSADIRKSCMLTI